MASNEGRTNAVNAVPDSASDTAHHPLQPILPRQAILSPVSFSNGSLRPDPSALAQDPWYADSQWAAVDLASGTVPAQGSVPSTYDMDHLMDLDDIFTFTNDLIASETARSPNPPLLPDTAAGPTTTLWTISQNIFQPSLDYADFEYLRKQGCFDLPSQGTFHNMMCQYFRLVHTNLPIIAEDNFWSHWQGEAFDLGDFSFLVLRAMLFSVSCYLDADCLSALGFCGQREARNTFYRQAKLLFDFETEKDPIANARACLLLTYMTPGHNKLRVSSSWLLHAVRFARISRADCYYIFLDDDPQKAKMCKRLWWAILFRDRILSLGNRRSLQVHIDADSVWYEQDTHVLQPSDFDSELGQSPNHNLETQLCISKYANRSCLDSDAWLTCVANPS